MRALLASDDAARALRGRPVRLPHRARARLAGRGRAAGSTRWCSPRGIGEHAAGDPRARLPRRRRGSAWSSTRRPTRPAARASARRPAGSRSWVIPTNEELMIARHTREDRRPRARHERSRLHDPLLKGAKALVCGIANEHSIAYGCAKAFRELGADLAITYLNEKAKALRRAAGARAGGADLHAARRLEAGRARGGVRAHRARTGAGSTSWCTPSPGRPRTTCRAACSTARPRASPRRWTSPAIPSCAWRGWPRR